MKAPLFLTLFLPLLLLLSATSSKSGIFSQLFLKPQEQFVLGGDQAGEFRVAAHNTGPVPVEIRERLRSGALRPLAKLAPKQRAQLRFAAGSTALLRNTTAQLATMELKVTGSLPHRMQMGPADGDGRL